jgi:hypothetical protein
MDRKPNQLVLITSHVAGIVSYPMWPLLKGPVKTHLSATAVFFPKVHSETRFPDTRRAKDLEKRKVRNHSFSINIPQTPRIQHTEAL